MSTLAYAALTTRRILAAPGTSTSTSPPGVTSYMDAVAALVPAEVLTLHAVILSVTTTTDATGGKPVTEIDDLVALQWAFWGMIVLSVVLYVVPRFRTREKLDLARAAIPPASFVVWTMLQRATAFDAVDPTLPAGRRTVIAVFAAVILGLAATTLAGKADQKPPP